MSRVCPDARNGRLPPVHEPTCPEYRILPPPNPAEVALLRITPEVVSILDYSKGFGHTDLVRVSERDLADFVESHRHHWAMRPVERGQGDQAWFVDD